MPKILVVDDEPDISKSVKLGLQRRGFEVDAFVDPSEAISRYQPGFYDMLIIDVKMQKMSGFDFAREIRKKDKKVHFAFLTAFDIYPSEFKNVFPELDARLLLRKPMLSEELARVIKSELDKSKSE